MAFAVLVLVAIGCYIVLPRFGVDLPSWVPLAAFAIIAVGVLANASSEGQFGRHTDGEDTASDRCRGGSCAAGGQGDGRPIGCCPGPRPPRFLGDGESRR
ncbi:MAG: hypothetical protein IPJ41_13760 [Phycisphaerales bacterium]|nr:hypothetical protein [Phycisphaerales bacterium]